MDYKYLNYVNIDSEQWVDVYNKAMKTISKDSYKMPSDEWKRKILKSEHSPIRCLNIEINANLPYWVSTHYVRHKYGIEHFVSTQRTDRTGINREDKPQGSIVNHTMVLNLQALINISRKRLCSMASAETREFWNEVKRAIADIDPIIAEAMVPDCVYRGHCYEFKGCGYTNSNDWFDELTRYRGI